MSLILYLDTLLEKSLYSEWSSPFLNHLETFNSLEFYLWFFKSFKMRAPSKSFWRIIFTFRHQFEPAAFKDDQILRILRDFLIEICWDYEISCLKSASIFDRKWLAHAYIWLAKGTTFLSDCDRAECQASKLSNFCEMIFRFYDF